MDNKNRLHPNPPDVDVAPCAPPSYEYNANYHQQQPASCSPSASSYQHHSSMMMPSAPPSIPPSQQHFTYGSVQPQPSLCHPYALYQQQHQHQQSYQEPPQHYRYIISSRDRGDRHFPVNAALFVLGWLFPPLCTELDCIHAVYHLLDSTHVGRTR
ncbi:Calmodulin [Mucor velutinosus]|uniref:Calmodulin n=1 Tax=Mucor velutinosus TaxID=708070 RepID=A0AAN7D9U6_9FUNG|nr:Calmodulin [Mucor velutinosus]